MSLPEALVTVLGWDECPLYEVEDEFKISGLALNTPYGKSACMILANDIMELPIKYGNMDSDRRYIFDCSGCSGMVRLQYRKEITAEDIAVEGKSNEVDIVVNVLNKLPLFQSLEESNLRKVVSFLKLNKFEAGEQVIKKGDPGKNLFIIVSGRVEILNDDGLQIAKLGSGEVFGEMSILSGDPVIATVQVLEPTRVLYLDGDHFRKILNEFPSLQMYLACLLARRLADTNILMSEEFSSGMTGRLSEMPPTGLLQTLNLNQKTGILRMELSQGKANINFRDGEVIRAQYHKMKDKDAFFQIIQEKHGRFKFVPGLPEQEMNLPGLDDFMSLLMEGVRLIDESREE